MKKLRILALMHDYLVPPNDTRMHNLQTVKWKTEHDVTSTLEEIGHSVELLGVKDELEDIRRAIGDYQPHIVFNLLEAFHEIGTFDQNLVSYLELLRVPYTGCNPRGLLLSRDKALAKKLLTYHHIPVPDFAVFRIDRKIKRPEQLSFPLIIKSLTQDASIGIAQSSVVNDDARLSERITFIHKNIGTDAIVEQYIRGRELYVGVVGNERLQTFPIWEMYFTKMPKGSHRIATDRTKWSTKYQKKYGIRTGQARNLSPVLAEHIQQIAKRVYRALELSGYARIDFRLTVTDKIFVLEANPNPQIAFGEDFAESAERGGLSYENLLQQIINSGLRWQPERLG